MKRPGSALSPEQRVAVLARLPLGVVVIDRDGEIVHTNPIADAYLPLLTDTPADGRLTHLGGRPVDGLRLPDPAEAWHELSVLDGATRRFFEACCQCVDGEEDGLSLIVLREVTRARSVQLRQQHEDQLAVLSRFAGGVAHDFSNLLQAIIGFADLMSARNDIPDDARVRLETIAEQGRRGAALVGQLADYAGRTVDAPRPLELRAFMAGLVEGISTGLPPGMWLEAEVGGEPCWVRADPSRLENAVLNLARNAREAMPDGGRLGIHLGTVSVAPEDLPPVPGVSSGDWACITICDAGRGIPEEHLAHLFEPFFTTKPTGRGSGLGLAQANGAVLRLGGVIDVTSDAGEGTAVRVYLPAIEPPPQSTR